MTLVESQKKSIFRRFWDRVIAFEDAMEYSGFDYTLDRIAGLEKQIAELRDELRDGAGVRVVAGTCHGDSESPVKIPPAVIRPAGSRAVSRVFRFEFVEVRLADQPLPFGEAGELTGHAVERAVRLQVAEHLLHAGDRGL